MCWGGGCWNGRCSAGDAPGAGDELLNRWIWWAGRPMGCSRSFRSFCIAKGANRVTHVLWGAQDNGMISYSWHVGTGSFDLFVAGSEPWRAGRKQTLSEGPV